LLLKLKVALQALEHLVVEVTGALEICLEDITISPTRWI